MTWARVRVPATVADLGAGRDRIGIAVDRWLTVSADLQGTRGVTIERAGTLAALDVPPWRDQLHIGFGGACWAACHVVPTNIRFAATSDIPIGRGLGASAAAVVAGVLLANAVLSLGLDEATMLSVAADIAERTDRVAAALHGGACLLLPPAPSLGEHAPAVAPVVVRPDLAVVIAVPDGKGHADAGHDAGHDAVRCAAQRAGATGATRSGSGTSLVAISPAECADAVAAAMVDAWGAHGVSAATFVSAGAVSGAQVESRPTHDGGPRDAIDRCA
ncbi:MAG TPA: hypothetical protein VFS44_05010 [Gemmatimonadaceae bacterium]|nr:hypothetical protein [Gemmatimonadaceae bacterium]